MLCSVVDEWTVSVACTPWSCDALGLERTGGSKRKKRDVKRKCQVNAMAISAC